MMKDDLSKWAKWRGAANDEIYGREESMAERVIGCLAILVMLATLAIFSGAL